MPYVLKKKMTDAHRKAFDQEKMLLKSNQVKLKQSLEQLLIQAIDHNGFKFLATFPGNFF